MQLAPLRAEGFSHTAFCAFALGELHRESMAFPRALPGFLWGPLAHSVSSSIPESAARSPRSRKGPTHGARPIVPLHSSGR